MDGSQSPGKVEVDPVEDPFVVDCQAEVCKEVKENPNPSGSPFLILLHDVVFWSSAEDKVELTWN